MSRTERSSSFTEHSNCPAVARTETKKLRFSVVTFADDRPGDDHDCEACNEGADGDTTSPSPEESSPETPVTDESNIEEVDVDTDGKVVSRFSFAELAKRRQTWPYANTRRKNFCTGDGLDEDEKPRSKSFTAQTSFYRRNRSPSPPSSGPSAFEKRLRKLVEDLLMSDDERMKSKENEKKNRLAALQRKAKAKDTDKVRRRARRLGMEFPLDGDGLYKKIPEAEKRWWEV